MVTHTFGDVLFSSGSECSSEFPSPESLKRKIIISTKPPKEYLETKSIKERDDHSRKAKNLSEEAAWGKEVSDIADHLKIRNEVDQILIILHYLKHPCGKISFFWYTKNYQLLV